MIRIWKGPEMEGDEIGIMTLFVCADREVNTNKLINIIEQNPDIKRVYLGAGKHSFEGATEWFELIAYLIKKSINVVMEVNSFQMREMINRYDNSIITFIVSNYDMPVTYNDIRFKTDDNYKVTIFNPGVDTSLKTLQDNNLFTCDTMLLEED